jgi:hypothetical protein
VHFLATQNIYGVTIMSITLTNTGLDQLTNIILSDKGLLANKKVLATDIQTGAASANSMNAFIIEAIKATGVANDKTLNAADLRDVNGYLLAKHGAEWVTLHGNDEGAVETGFHLVQNDGGTSQLLAKNAINTVADGIYHMGFAISGNNFLNEDGAKNASLADVATWLNSLLSADLSKGTLSTGSVVDLSTTNTGLDQITDTIVSDAGLQAKIATSQINAGATAANSMNKFIIEAIKATGVANDKTLNAADLRDVNGYLLAKHGAEWVTLHGNDEGAVETGFHLVQGDGGTSQLLAKNAINTVADGIYHMGFAISGNNFLNEDGAKNASLADVATWLNSLLSADLANGSLHSVGVVGQTTVVDVTPV